MFCFLYSLPGYASDLWLLTKGIVMTATLILEITGVNIGHSGRSLFLGSYMV